MSTVDTCVTQPACGAAISSEVAPAVTAPTGAGWGASTLSTTTATGTTSTYVKAVAGIAVVTGGVLTPESTTNDANIARWHYWSQATNSRAQEIARQRYCAAYLDEQVGNYTKISYVQGYGYRPGCLPPVFVSIQIPFGQEGKIISKSEVRRDAILVEQGWEMEWVFQGTASEPLLEDLRNAGIGYRFREP